MSSSARDSTEPAYQVLSFQPHQEAHARKYIKRKSHRKSRGGCLGCKLSRVKCDEGKPSCGRCFRCSVDCQYPSPGRKRTLAASEPARGGKDYGAVVTNYTFPFPPARLSSIALAGTYMQSASPARGLSRVSLLHHLNQHFHFANGLETAGGQIASIVRLGMSRPYLLDVTLAVAACHLRHMHQAAGNTSSSRSDAVAACRVAEHYQQSLAIRGFNRALTEPFDQQGSDSALVSCMMFSLLSFTLNSDDEDPSNSWVFSNAPDRLAWFSLNLGLTPLLLRTKRFRNRSVLCDMFAASDDENRTYHGNNTKPLSKVPPHWLFLCGLDYGSDDPEHIFYEPVRILAELVPIPVSQQSFFLYTAFFGKVDAAFRALLEADDERAMWLLGYWFGLLCRFDYIWWLSARVRRDYRAVCIWLDKRKVRWRAGTEGVMWRQLMVDLEGATQPPVELGTSSIERPER